MNNGKTIKNNVKLEVDSHCDNNTVMVSTTCLLRWPYGSIETWNV